MLLSLTKHDSLCLAGTASGGFTGAPVKGRLKLRRVHKPRGLPKACRKLVRDLPR